MQFLYWIYVLFYSECSVTYNKDVFEDAIKHENANHKCKYIKRKKGLGPFGLWVDDCPYKGLKFLEKVEIKNFPRIL